MQILHTYILLHTNDTKFNKKVNLTLKSDSDTYPSRIPLSSIHFQEVGHVKLFLLNVKERLNDHFIQGWHSRIENSSRAAFYKHVTHFKF